jgi:hypothetical protein
MPTRRGFVQGYNAQVAVTGDQIIVAVPVGQSPTDMAAFVPMMQAAQDAAQRLHQLSGQAQQVIGTVLADAGYASDANLAAPGPDRLIALGKARDQAKDARTAPRSRGRTAERHPTPGDAPPAAHRRGRRLYTRRGATVEPGIGNLKKLIDRFSRRGPAAVTSELRGFGSL